MKPFGKKRGHPLDLPASGLTGRQLTAIAVAFAFAIVLLPVGARAASALLNVVITDPGGTNKAQVDASGHLKVAGQVTVDSSTPVAITSTDDPARMAFQTFDVQGFGVSQHATFEFNVPEDKRLVITQVSGLIHIPFGQTPIEIVMATHAGGPVQHSFVSIPTGSDSTGDQFAFSQDTTIYADGDFTIDVTRSDDAGDTGAARLAISGYLIDCSGGSCN